LKQRESSRGKIMKAKRYLILGSVVVCCVAILPLQLSGTIDSEQTREDKFAVYVLEGLKGVDVKVVQLLSAFEESRLPRNPIDVNDLEAQAEHILHRAGIWVFQDSSQDPEIAQLVITVNTWKTKFAHSFIVQVKTELCQLAELVRGKRLRIMAPTWPVGVRIEQAEMTAVINLLQIRKVVQEEVKRQIGIFIEDYCIANPCIRPVMTGTIRYISIEGGFYGIVADSGERYDPINLPQEFAKDGLRVKFQVKEVRGRVSVRMWGRIVRIIKIAKL